MASRFMFHIKFSKSEDYLHEHELYEVMRSRNLYQTQFEVRSGFKQRMRIIEKTEKAENNGFINTRKLFVQKMQQRMEQADKLKQLMSVKISKTMLGKGVPKKAERRYIPMHPTAGSTTLAFPDIVQKFKTPSPGPVLASDRPPTGSLSPASGKATSEAASSLPYDAPSPSMAASTIAATTVFARNDNTRHQPVNTTVPDVVEKATAATHDKDTDDPHAGQQSVEGKSEPSDDLKCEEADVLPELNAPRSTMHYNEAYFIEKSDERFAIPEKTETSNNCDNTTSDNFTTTDDLESESANAKVEHWTMQYGLACKSKQEIEDEKTFRRLLVDRPSKWALSHVHNNTLQSSTYNITRTTIPEETAEQTFKTETQKSVISTNKLNAKTKAYVSLPELDNTPRPMVSMDPGGTTPDGRLILTKADYEGYLYGYRQANLVRLNKSKIKSKILNRLVNDFSATPKLQQRSAKEILTVQSEP